MWLAALAYVLIGALCRIALPATRLAQATAGTIRLKLRKIGALVRLSVRRITIKMASGHPYQHDWAIAHAALGSCPSRFSNPDFSRVVGASGLGMSESSSATKP